MSVAVLDRHRIGVDFGHANQISELRVAGSANANDFQDVSSIDC